MSKHISKLLCCGALLTQLLCIANIPLTANASHHKYHYHTTREVYSLPQYMQTNLNDYYQNHMPQMTTKKAKHRAKDLENLWHNFNNEKSVQKRYGHMSKAAYFTRLYNERTINNSTVTGKNMNTSLRFYGYLNSNLTTKQKKAIRLGYRAKNLTKTQQRLLVKYGITNQFVAKCNRNAIALGQFAKIRIPAAAHLSHIQRYNLHNNLRIDGLNDNQIHVLSTYGLPVSNGQNIEATSIYATIKPYNRKPKSNTSIKKLNTIMDYVNAAQKGIQLPHYIYAVIISPNGSTRVQEFNTTNPSYMTELIKQYQASGKQIQTDNHNLDKNYNNTNLPTNQSKENQMAQDYLQDAYISKDKNGNPMFYTIIDNKPVKFTKDANSWHAHEVSNNTIQDPSIMQLEKNASFINSGENGNISIPSDETTLDPSSDTPSDMPSDDTPKNVNTTQDAVPSDEIGNGGLPTTNSNNPENGAGIPNIQKSNKIAKTEEKAAKEATRAKQKARQNALNMAQHFQNMMQNTTKSKQISLSKKRDAAIQLANQDKNLANANKHNVTAIRKENQAQDSKLQQIQTTAASLKPLSKANLKVSKADQQAVNHDIHAVAKNMPGLSSSEANSAVHYFQLHPYTLITPNKIKNKSAKKMFHVMVETPEAVTHKTNPKKSGRKAAKHNKQHKGSSSKEYTNNGLSAYDLQKIHQLSQQISQIEHHAQTAKHQTAHVNSIESIPYDGYIQIHQGYGTYPITSKPDDIPGAKTIVNTSVIKHINSSKNNSGKFWIVNLVAKTSDGQKYDHVMSTNGMISGWINAKGLLTNKAIKSKSQLIKSGIYPVMHALKNNKNGLNPDFVDAYEGVVQEYINGNKALQKLVHHKFNQHQVPLARMYSPKDLSSKDKGLDNIATRFQELVRIKMGIPQFSNQATYLTQHAFK